MTFPRRSLLAALAAALALPARAAETARLAETVRIGQATTSLSFVPLWAARALDTFAKQGLTLQWAAIPGGDPTTLAALDSGDIDLAAVGGDTLLAAVAKGQPFKAVATLMNRVTLDLVVSNAFLERTKTSPAAPLQKRLAALNGALVGVSAVGGAQDRAVRWLATQGGIDPKAVQIALVGSPPALQATLANNQVEAFVLSPPEAQIAEAAGYGHRLIGMAADFPMLQEVPFLVLAAKVPVPHPDRTVATLKALAAADDAILADPAKVADAIHAKFFAKIAPEIIRAGTKALEPGIANKGVFGPASAGRMLLFAQQSGIQVGHVKPEQFWTPTYIDQALR